MAELHYLSPEQLADKIELATKMNILKDIIGQSETNLNQILRMTNPNQSMALLLETTTLLLQTVRQEFESCKAKVEHYEAQVNLKRAAEGIPKSFF